MQTSILIPFLQLLWMKAVLANNFGIPFQLSYAPSTRIVTETESNSTILFSNPLPRQINRAYTIVYPLTFPQSRGGKVLNLTLPSQQPSINEVQSRVISKPEPYPNFVYLSPFRVYTQDRVEEANNPQQESPEEFYDDSSELADDNSRIKNVAFPPLPSQYVPKTNVLLSPQSVYTNKSSDAESPFKLQTDNKPSNSKFPSLGYGKYAPSASKPPPRVSAKPVSPQQVLRPPKAFIKPVTPLQIFPPSPLAPVIKSSVPPVPFKRIVNKNNPVSPPAQSNKFPKYDISPSTPGKSQISPVRPPVGAPEGAPVGLYKKQPAPPPAPRAPQYASCICVPYYLCKDGVLNSGGRLQEAQKRKTRSLNYIQQSKNVTTPFKSNIVNLNTGGRNLDQEICEPNKVCCEIYFEGSIGDPNYNDNVYPVATPPPELPAYPPPSRFPTKPRSPYTCGVQRTLDTQTRPRQAQYPADVADFGEYPWQIAILRKVVGDKNLYLCGGVMVAPQWIATVAHCVSKFANAPLLVRLGEWDVKRKDEIYPYIEKGVTTMVIHPDFDPESLQGDLALLRLIDPVDSNMPHINPACLPTPGQVYEDQKCWVTGWGKNFFGPQGEYQSILKEVDIPVISRSLCSSQLRSTNLGPDFVLHPGFLCAGGEVGKDACTGDGGSPLVCKSRGLWYVVGMVSWGIGCGQAGVPGVYVNVLYYTDWINNVIKNSL